MKYVILVGDGMGDFPQAELNGKTPLEHSRTPNMDRLASTAVLGTVRTIPDGMEPGSDIANMALLGYDPARYHTGRGPLEAAAMGVKLEPGDIAFRCNVVHIAEDGGTRIMGDHSAGHITTDESRRLAMDIQKVTRPPLFLHPGVSYRHLLVWRGGPEKMVIKPPHDFLGEPVEPYEKVFLDSEILNQFREDAAAVLAGHPVNEARIAAGKRDANAVWPWGQGPAPAMPTLKERYGLTGTMISAVDLLKGLGVYAGLENIDVPGATGYLDTNYEGKVEAALRALRQHDFVYLHVEAPDETSHEGDLKKKIQAIEDFDAHVVGPVMAGLADLGDARVLIAPDHLTPISIRTHSSDPVPFMLVTDGGAGGGEGERLYCEKTAAVAGLKLNSGMELFELLLGK